MLAMAREHYPRWYPLLLCAVRTGMRQGELLALRWPDVDFAGRFIEVNRNLVRGIVTTPKNHQRRRVDMSAQLTAELAAHSARLHERGCAAGLSRAPFVFPSDDRTMLDESNVRKMFQRILATAQMRHVRFPTGAGLASTRRLSVARARWVSVEPSSVAGPLFRLLKVDHRAGRSGGRRGPWWRFGGHPPGRRRRRYRLSSSLDGSNVRRGRVPLAALSDAPPETPSTRRE